MSQAIVGKSLGRYHPLNKPDQGAVETVFYTGAFIRKFEGNDFEPNQ
jgi:hypothetical protein